MNKARAGFTIVELLIVIVVIAILAAISIVAYNGIQDRASVSVVKSDLSNIAKKVELYRAENGQYPPNIAEMRKMQLKTSSDYMNVAIYCGSADGYVVFMNTNRNKGSQYKLESGFGVSEVTPRLGWSGSTLCGSTSYISYGWNGSW